MSDEVTVDIMLDRLGEKRIDSVYRLGVDWIHQLFQVFQAIFILK